MESDITLISVSWVKVGVLFWAKHRSKGRKIPSISITKHPFESKVKDMYKHVLGVSLLLYKFCHHMLRKCDISIHYSPRQLMTSVSL